LLATFVEIALGGTVGVVGVVVPVPGVVVFDGAVPVDGVVVVVLDAVVVEAMIVDFLPALAPLPDVLVVAALVAAAALPLAVPLAVCPLALGAWCVVTRWTDHRLPHAVHLQRVQVPSR